MLSCMTYLWPLTQHGGVVVTVDWLGWRERGLFVGLGWDIAHRRWCWRGGKGSTAGCLCVGACRGYVSYWFSSHADSWGGGGRRESCCGVVDRGAGQAVSTRFWGGSHQPFWRHDGLLGGQRLPQCVPQNLWVRNVLIAVRLCKGIHHIQKNTLKCLFCVMLSLSLKINQADLKLV